MKFYSEKLKKLFDTEKDLVAAEKVVDEENAKKELAASQKKEEANKVQDAFKARNAARREYNTKLIEARKIYNDALVVAKKAFNEAVNEAASAKDKAEDAYNDALKEFTAKHGSFHMTLKDGDNVVTISNSSDKNFEDMGKEYSDFLNSLLNIWKF
jgi:YesN/AraC family two-component response regulator